MNNISSKFKYTVDLGLEATKTSFRLKKSTKDKVVHILAIVFIFVMAGVLIYDVIRDASLVIDLIILVALCAIEIFNLIMPKIIVHNQKKFLQHLDLAQIEYTTTEIKKDKCLESYYKDGKIVMQNVCEMSKLIAYEIKQNYVFAVFDNFACAIFDTKSLSVDIKEFTQMLDDRINKNKFLKSKKR